MRRAVVAEAIGTVLLLTVIVIAAVGAFIAASYWFIASTSFANPAVTIARAATDTFSGIRPDNEPRFMVAQVLGAGTAAATVHWLRRSRLGGNGFFSPPVNALILRSLHLRNARRHLVVIRRI